MAAVPEVIGNPNRATWVPVEPDEMGNVSKMRAVTRGSTVVPQESWMLPLLDAPSPRRRWLSPKTGTSSASAEGDRKIM